MFLDWLEAAPDRIGWFAWYALAAGDGAAAAVLVAGAGFKGPPQDGTAEIGYSVLPQFQGRGYATELVGGLVRWAVGQPGVARVMAETEWAKEGLDRDVEDAGSRFDGGGVLLEHVEVTLPPLWQRIAPLLRQKPFDLDVEEIVGRHAGLLRALFESGVNVRFELDAQPRAPAVWVWAG